MGIEMVPQPEKAKAKQGPPPAHLEIEIAERTDAGCVRPNNEDHVEHRIPTESRMRARKGILCLVADGMGGYRAGEVASREAVELVMRHYYGDLSRDVVGSLSRALRAANAAIHTQSQADRSRAHMGTTLVGAVVRGSQVVVANVGDSRAYLVSRKGIKQITEDHSWVEEQVRAGMLTPEMARTHPQRNLVTRALGSREAVEVDLFEGAIADADCLVLCTDGLTNHVQDREIESIVRGKAPDEAARLLIELAKGRGGNDNVTVLVARASQEEADEKGARGGRTGAPLWPLLLLGVAVLLALLALVLYLLPDLGSYVSVPGVPTLVLVGVQGQLPRSWIASR